MKILAKMCWGGGNHAFPPSHDQDIPKFARLGLVYKLTSSVISVCFVFGVSILDSHPRSGKKMKTERIQERKK